MFKNLEIFLIIFISAISLLSCSSKPVFIPEVGGAGAISSSGGVVFSIPPEEPLFKLKLVPMVIPNINGLHLRMYFIRMNDESNIYLDLREISISLPDSPKEIFSENIGSTNLEKPQVILTKATKQVVELVFRLPLKGSHQYPFINYKWKIHYIQNGMEKTFGTLERFNHEAKVNPQMNSKNFETDGFPENDVVNGPFPSEWTTPW